MTSLITRMSAELGLKTLLNSPRDTHLLCLQRFVRMFAYGATALILALFLTGLGISDARVGAFMTATLLGDVIISLVLTLFADALGRRKTLVVGSALMAMSGVVFAVGGGFWVLVAASIIGVISPSGNEIGPFRALEESTMAQLCSKEARSDIFAWYNLIGSAGAACGQLSCGWLVQRLENVDGWTSVRAYRVIFGIYALLGLIKLGLSLMLSPQCEAVKKVVSEAAEASTGDAGAEHLLSPMNDHEDDNNAEAAGLHEEATTPVTSSKPIPSPRPHVPPRQHRRVKTLLSLLPPLSAQSRTTVLKLSLLFAIDSFASGMIGLSWQSYYFTSKFTLTPSTLGTLFSAASLVASLSNLFAASLAKRIGLIRTMVFTHLPSAICLALIPASPYLGVAVTFLVLRSCTSTMDAAPRQAFLAQAVLSAERTAVMGVVNVVKTLSQSAGPSVTGWLAGSGRFWMAFVAAGTLKAGYDLSMLAMFVGFKAPEEEELEAVTRRRGQV